MTAKEITFDNGDTLPALGLGTWKSQPGEVGAAVRAALEIGYRHIDCAWIYGNEAEVGEALADALGDGLVTRDELWITSKLWNDRHATEDVLPAIEETLSALRLDHLDLYLVHWPVALKPGKHMPESADDMLPLEELPLAETWAGMESTVDAGLARHIGVSNFSAAKIAALAEDARMKPEVNQVELHPYLAQRELLATCAEHGVVVTAYSPLGSPDRPASMLQEGEPVLLEDPGVGAVAARHDATPAQVLIAWALARGTSVIPKSVSPERLRENFMAQELELTEADMAELDALDRHRRYVTGAFWGKHGGPYTLSYLWDE